MLMCTDRTLAAESKHITKQAHYLTAPQANPRSVTNIYDTAIQKTTLRSHEKHKKHKLQWTCVHHPGPHPPKFQNDIWG